MGCGASHSVETTNTTPIDRHAKSHLTPRTNEDSTSPNKLYGREIKSKDEFHVTTLDLVSAKAGKIAMDYQLLSPPLGSGAFGEVRKAIHKLTKLERAVKIINKSAQSQEDQERLINEVEILRKLDHPNIIKIYEFYQDSKFFYIVTELCTGGELFDKITKMSHFDEQLAAETMKQILSAVVYCHKFKIVHRDLKPENVLLESEKEDSLLKVIDFGTSKEFNPSTKMNQKFGTPYYIAPEVLKRRYDEKCDVWSCGVILYIVLCGYPPFNGASDKIIMEKVAKGTFSFPAEEWSHISDDAKRLIKRMLSYEPENRCTAEEALNDGWMKKWSAASTKVEKPIALRALNNLRTFRAERKLQEATWVFLVSYFATKEEKEELLRTFRALDLNSDGLLSREELIEGYKKIMNAAEAAIEVERILSVVDTNNSGHIDYSEWVTATINRQGLLSKQRLEAAFRMFDKDGNGFISTEELRSVFGQNVSGELWKELIKEVDDNGDGQISLKEFKEMMMNVNA